MTNLSIYVHIPFCESKCIYCGFSSFVPNQQQVENYFKTLWSEISQRAKWQCGKIIQTIFFGGGTPSFVESKFITKTLEMIRQNFNVSKNAEISIECNPNSATFDKLKDYVRAGFNRISFGVQSLDDNLLKFLGRRHDKLTALRAINDAKEVGFSNINADLLLGLVGQNKQNIIDDINSLVDAGITHISTYMLMVEKHTPLCALKDKKKYIMSDDNSVDLYNDVVKANIIKFIGHLAIIWDLDLLHIRLLMESELPTRLVLKNIYRKKTHIALMLCRKMRQKKNLLCLPFELVRGLT